LENKKNTTAYIKSGINMPRVYDIYLTYMKAKKYSGAEISKKG
jgi:hypothetical protein